MEKRLFLAIALALLVLISWQVFASKTYHVDNKDVTSIVPAQAQSKPVQKALNEVQVKAEVPPTETALFEFSQEKYDILFSESQAAIKEIHFKLYQNYSFPLTSGFSLGDPGLIFKTGNIDPESVSFVYKDAFKEIKKVFLFSKTNYSIKLEINVQNLSNEELTIDFPVLLGIMDINGNHEEARLKDVILASKDKVMHISLRKDSTLDEIKFAGFRDRYFSAIIAPKSIVYTGFVGKINSQKYEIGLKGVKIPLAPGQQEKLYFDIYLGPQDLQQISSVNPEWVAVMYYGTFDIIAHVLLQVLDFIFGLVHNWGLTIIIISVLIYALLYPLTLKQMRSMKQMQLLQPRIEELRKIYKDNPKKLNTEIMGLYREFKVNPLGGCLPLILQIPVFFALYQVLIRSVALKGAHFLWIKDLSAPDRLFTLPVSLPLLGNEVNLLPILMAIGMFFQQKLSMSATTGAGSAEQQKLMMILFPLMFGFIFYRMPSGLVLYWFINSGLMLFNQLRISRNK